MANFTLLINPVHWGYNPLILTFDPNFQQDILGGIRTKGSNNLLHLLDLMAMVVGLIHPVVDIDIPGGAIQYPNHPIIPNRLHLSYDFFVGKKIYFFSQNIYLGFA